MKKIISGFLLLLASAGSLSSCKDESKIPAPEFESVAAIFPQINPTKNFYNWATSRAAASSNPTRSVFEFTIDPGQQARDLKLETVEVYKSYRREGVLGPRVKVGDYSSFPATVSLNSTQALAGLKRLADTELIDVLPPDGPDAFNNRIVKNIDAIVFTFEYVVEGGRRIVLTPLNRFNAPIGKQILPPYAAVAVFRDPTP